MGSWANLALFLAWGLSLGLLILLYVVIYKILKVDIDIRTLLSETGGTSAGERGEAANKASLSRLQLFVFTFVIAGVYLVMCLESGTFVTIPEQALWLLGLSAGSYALSKAISKSPTP